MRHWECVYSVLGSFVTDLETQHRHSHRLKEYMGSSEQASRTFDCPATGNGIGKVDVTRTSCADQLQSVMNAFSAPKAEVITIYTHNGVFPSENELIFRSVLRACNRYSSECENMTLEGNDPKANGDISISPFRKANVTC